MIVAEINIWYLGVGNAASFYFLTFGQTCRFQNQFFWSADTFQVCDPWVSVHDPWLIETSFPEGNLGEVTWCKYNSEASSPHIPWDAARTKLATEVTLEGPGSGLPAGRRYSSEHHKRSVVWGVSHPIISNSPLCSWSVNMAKKKQVRSLLEGQRTLYYYS